MDEDTIIELWDVFKEYVPEKNRENAANHYVDYLTGKDVKISVLEELVGFDPHLDSAINLVLKTDEDDYEDEDEDNDWAYGEDDEDY